MESIEIFSKLIIFSVVFLDLELQQTAREKEMKK